MKFSKKEQAAIVAIARGGETMSKRTKARKPQVGPTENQVKKSFQDFATQRGVFVWRCNSGSLVFNRADGSKAFLDLAPTGTADVIGLLPDGRFLGVEVKRPDKWPTKEQIAWMQRVNKNNGVAIWADNLATLDRLLKHVLAGGRVVVSDYGRIETIPAK